MTNRKMQDPSYVYMLASKKDGVLYIGVTTELAQRVWQHKNNVVKGFTQKYNVKNLVWYEAYESVESAITREKQLKKWNRSWKTELIEATNPDWQDLYEQIAQ
jgi:putative endonuclease